MWTKSLFSVTSDEARAALRNKVHGISNTDWLFTWQCEGNSTGITHRALHADKSFTKVFALLQKTNNVSLMSFTVGVKRRNCAKLTISNDDVYYETSLYVDKALLTLSKHTLATEKLCILNASSMLLLCVSLGNHFWRLCFRKLWTGRQSHGIILSSPRSHSWHYFWMPNGDGTMHAFIENNVLNFRTLMSSTCHMQCAPP